MKNGFVVVMLLLFSSMVLSSCNTVEGVGEDAQEAGEAVQDTVD
jgi:predicted small secreted protein